MKRKRKTVYIVLHHEIFDDGCGGHRADEMVFYIVSSMKRAMIAITTSHVSDYSWWEIQKQTLDDAKREWPERVGIFGRKGGKLKASPFGKCVPRFEKWKADLENRLPHKES